MFEVKEKPEMVERAMLLRITWDRREAEAAESLLEELKELVKTLGIEVEEVMLVFARSEHKKYLCGTGKAVEVSNFAQALDCDVLIFDNMLSPMQQRAWEESANMTVMDREEVILDIFAKRAQTREAQLQVELAKMQYALPRMAKMWGHLDREGGGGVGGGGASRGMGEKQIEVDRRLARQRINRIKVELSAVRKQRATRRKDREQEALPHAAIVGYTNAGKSTLLNALSGAEVEVADKLFATLDPTTRRVALPDGQPLLVTDTVGFIRNLPTRLVEAFKSTLEEAVLADFLIHVVDASDSLALEFYYTTKTILEELGAGDKQVITVLNKSDLIQDISACQALKDSVTSPLFLAAREGLGIELLSEKCAEILQDRIQVQHYKIEQSKGHLLSYLYEEGKVLNVDYEGNSILVEVAVNFAVAGRMKGFLSM